MRPKTDKSTTLRTVRRRESHRDEPGNPDSQGKSVSLAPDGRGIGGTKKLSRLLLLKEQDCPDRWEAVCDCLKNVKGLQLQDGNRILAVSKLDEADLGAVTEAIAILVDANRPMGACTLIGMCKPSMLIVLLEPCTSSQVNELKTSDDPTVRKAMDRPLRAAARRAWKDGDFLRCRNLVQFCSAEVKASFIRRSFSLIGQMTRLPVNDDMLVEAMRAALAWVPELDMEDGLTAVGDLLRIANDLRAHELARSVAIKCIAWPALGQIAMSTDKLQAMAWFPELTPELLDAVPASLRSEVLRIAVEQAANSWNIEACTDRLLGLASLSRKIGGALAKELKSHVTSALSQLYLQWDEEVYRSHQHSLLKVEKKAQRVRPAGIMESLKAKAGRILGKDSADAGTLVHLAKDFRLALQDGNLHTAALLIHDSPYPEFGDAAREELFNAVVGKFAEVGLNLELGHFKLTKKPEENIPELAAKQDSVVLEMAAVLMVTGEPYPYYSMLAASILSAHFATQQRQQAAIQRLIEGLGIGLRTVTVVDVLNGDLVYALPELCSVDHAVALEIILAMEEGRSLIAIAVVDLLQDDCSDATIASLFKALARRIDLRPALPPIQTGILQVDGRIVMMPMESPQLKMMKILRRLRMAKLDSEYAKHCDQWVPGWRLLACMHDQPGVFDEAVTVLLAVLAIDAAAADGLHGGAEELLDRLHDSSVELALRAMLESQVSGKSLLSDEALVNVMRAFIIDGRLAARMFTWMLPWPDLRRLHLAAAQALISLLDDVTPSRFDPTRLANHAVAHVADAFMVSLARNEMLALDVQKQSGPEALKRIEDARNS